MCVFRFERTIFKLKQSCMCLFGTVKACSRFGWLCVCVLMTSEASSDAMAFDLTNSDVRRGNGCGFRDIRGFRWHGK